MAKTTFSSKTDKGGNPYIEHILTVYSKCIRHYDDFDFNLQLVAILHDILEDSDLTKEELQHFFDVEVVNAVVAMTHDKYDSYDEYIEKVLQNRFATIVKRYDLEHNMDTSRIKEVNEKDIQRIEKYKNAHAKVMAKLKAMGEEDGNEYMTSDQINYKLMVLDGLVKEWDKPNYLTMFLVKLKDDLSDMLLKKFYPKLIYWTNQNVLTGLQHSTKIGTYKDFKFDIRYDHDANSSLKDYELIDCGAILNIYIMGAKVKRLRCKSVSDCIVESERFLESFIKRYNIKIE
jgi:hypothetical protein